MDCDSRAAWEGAYPGQDGIPIRVEAGAFRSRPVYFRVIPPWRKPRRMAMAPARPGAAAVEVIGLGLMAAIVVGGIVLARRNLRLGRGDWKGGVRLGSYVFSLYMLSWILGGHHAPSLGEVGLLF